MSGDAGDVRRMSGGLARFVDFRVFVRSFLLAQVLVSPRARRSVYIAGMEKMVCSFCVQESADCKRDGRKIWCRSCVATDKLCGHGPVTKSLACFRHEMG